MSIIDELHRAHKERLERIAMRAVEGPAPSRRLQIRVAAPKPPTPPVTPGKRLGEWADRCRTAHAEEAAWNVAITGEAADDDAKKKPTQIPVRIIQRACCVYYGIGLVDMLSARRIKSISLPRHVAMYLTKCMTTRSLPDIGRLFGGKDHTTVMHAVRKIEHLSGTDEGIASDLWNISDAIERAIRGPE